MDAYDDMLNALATVNADLDRAIDAAESGNLAAMGLALTDATDTLASITA